MYHIFFIHSSVDAHLGCFNVLAIVNIAAVNMYLCKLEFSSFPGICPGMGLLDMLCSIKVIKDVTLVHLLRTGVGRLLIVYKCTFT